MSLFVLDTDHLTLYYTGHPIVVQKIDSRLPTELAISVLTVDEQLTGWYALTRQARRPKEVARAYSHLSEAVVRLGRWRHSALYGSGNCAGCSTEGPSPQRRVNGPADSCRGNGKSVGGRHPQPARLRPYSRPER